MSFESKIKELIDKEAVPESISPMSLADFLEELAAENAADKSDGGEIHTAAEVIPKKKQSGKRRLGRRIFLTICTAVAAVCAVSSYVFFFMERPSSPAGLSDMLSPYSDYNELYSDMQSVYSETAKAPAAMTAAPDWGDITAEYGGRIFYLSKENSAIYGVASGGGAEITASAALEEEPPIGMISCENTLVVLGGSEDFTSVEVFSLPGLVKLHSFKQSGGLRYAYFEGGTLCLVTGCDLSENLLTDTENTESYVPYTENDGEISFIPASDIYSPYALKTPVYTVFTAYTPASGEGKSFAAVGSSDLVVGKGGKIYTVLGRVVAGFDMATGAPEGAELVGGDVISLYEYGEGIAANMSNGSYMIFDAALSSASEHDGSYAPEETYHGVPLTASRLISALTEESMLTRVIVKDAGGAELYSWDTPDFIYSGDNDSAAILADPDANVIAVPMYSNDGWLFKNSLLLFSYDEYSGLIPRGEISYFSNGRSGFFKRSVISGDYLYAFSDTCVITARLSDFKVAARSDFE